MLNKLEYTLKIATSKLEELENLDEKIQLNMASMFKQHFKELTLDPETGDDTESNYTMPKPKLYKNFASVGHVRISEMKHNTQEKSTASNKNRVNSNNQEKNNNPSTIMKKDGKKNTNSKGNNSKNACSVLKTSIKGMQTKESRRPSQDESLKAFHPKQAEREYSKGKQET